MKQNGSQMGDITLGDWGSLYWWMMCSNRKQKKDQACEEANEFYRPRLTTERRASDALLCVTVTTISWSNDAQQIVLLDIM